MTATTARPTGSCRVCMIYDFGGVGENSASMPFPVAYTLKSEYPDMVEEVVRAFQFSGRPCLAGV